jgi:tRNA(Ile)-lysidine synthase
LNNLLQQFKEYVKKENLFRHGERLLLAVSGGVDSVVLCELCFQSGYAFTIAHCNFQLRGEESDADADFVQQLGLRYQADVLVKKFDTADYAAAQKISIQVAARELRYNWFASSLLSLNLNLTLTAHHRDDAIETLLMNFFKGTGISGLHGILSKQGNIVRPLLFASKEMLLNFAKENDLPWREDSSNLSDKYTRNYLRHHLLPLVKTIYPEVENNLSGNITRFREAEILYRQSIALHQKKLLEPKGDEVHIAVLKLKKTEALSTVLYEIVKPYHFTPGQLPDIIHLLDAESGKYVISPTHRILRNRAWLIIAPLQAATAQRLLIEAGMQEINFEGRQLQLELLDTVQDINPDPAVAQLDAGQISFPLLLRRWEKGDYFYPLGMPKKKKLSRFFIDQKLSVAQKEKIWVIEMNKKIIWVAGMRIDDRFKITGKTKQVLLLKMKNEPA